MSEVGTLGPVAERDVALCRSVLYQALSLGFLPPDPQTVARLGRKSSVEALAEASRLLDEEGGTGFAGKTLALAAQEDSADLHRLRHAYQRLFGHVARGPVPPYETEYGQDEMFQKPHEMSDIAGFLGAFELQLDPAAHERVDHIACELEFAAFLARKEAHALETGDQPMRAETRKAMRLFLRDHLARFVPSFVARVRRESSGFYAALADLCLALVESDCRRHETPLGPATLRLRLPIEDNAPMACGTGEGCPGDCDPGPAGEETEG